MSELPRILLDLEGREPIGGGSPEDTYAVDPAHVCHGVMVDDGDGKRLVRVTPGDEYVVPDSYASLWEYTDEEGNVRACLLRVDARSDSPIWRIRDEAGDDVGQPYYEVHQLVAGRGEFGHVSRENIRATSAGYHNLGTLNMIGGLCVHSGERFAVDADREYGGDAWVLATFPGAPFKPEYETRDG